MKPSLPIIPDYERPTTAGEDTLREDFISGSSSDESSDTAVEEGQKKTKS